jgi:hypothetical protein
VYLYSEETGGFIYWKHCFDDTSICFDEKVTTDKEGNVISIKTTYAEAKAAIGSAK